MIDEPSTTLLEEIASSLVMAEASDPASLRELLSLLAKFSETPCAAPEGPIRTLLASCRSHLTELVEGKTPNPEASFAAISNAITELQRVVRDSPPPSLLPRPDVPKPEQAQSPSASPKPTASAAASPQTAPAPFPSAPLASPAAPGKVARDDETLGLLGEFLQEGEDGLGRADQILMNIERDGLDPEKINELFRVFHTIKGVAGFLELQEITSLAHTTETMLNLVRQGKLELKGAVLDVVFDATEMMRRMLEGVRRAIEKSEDIEPVADLAGLLEELKAVTEGRAVKEFHPPEIEKPDARIGEVLQETAAVPPEQIEAALESQRESGRKLGEELVAQGVVEPKQVAQALRAQTAAQGPPASKLKEMVKVDLERVDSLVEMIGELVIAESMVVNAPEISALSAVRIRNYLSQLTKITRDLQNIGMRMRMVPVRELFQKMSRLTRDLSRKSAKQITLLTAGEWTEVDRSMVDQLADPLVHMIRNSVDHGIERPEDRKGAGKPQTGTIRLSAYHQGGSIVVEIADDGNGLDKEAILAKARAQGMVKENESLSESEIFDLIFAPGFSTAKQVTEISGRGVGMDVVKRGIESMRGRVLISSQPGIGTTFKIILPLTLAIIDGMLVACGQERYIIPTLSIVESFQPEASMLNSFAEGSEMVNIRGEILPLLRMGRLFGIDKAKSNPTEALVVVVESQGRKIGLLVDDVVTQQQVVIKSPGQALNEIKFISGAAIMADGRVGLILNVEEMGVLVDDKKRRQGARTPPPLVPPSIKVQASAFQTA